MPPADGHTFEKPFQAEAEAVVARQIAARAARPSGVCWSAMTSPAPDVEDVDVVRQRLVDREAAALAWRKTPLGRFYGAIRDLAEVGYLDESDRLEGIYRRSLADAGPLDVAAVGAALTILNPIAGSTAREARGALAEMLMNVGRGNS